MHFLLGAAKTLCVSAKVNELNDLLTIIHVLSNKLGKTTKTQIFKTKVRRSVNYSALCKIICDMLLLLYKRGNKSTVPSIYCRLLLTDRPQPTI